MAFFHPSAPSSTTWPPSFPKPSRSARAGDQLARPPIIIDGTLVGPHLPSAAEPRAAIAARVRNAPNSPEPRLFPRARDVSGRDSFQRQAIADALVDDSAQLLCQGHARIAGSERWKP